MASLVSLVSLTLGPPLSYDPELKLIALLL
jgi:hypothetical protein